MAIYHNKGGLSMKSNSQALRLTLLYLMAAIELIFAFTPLGTFPIGPLAVTLNIIPIAVSAVLMGPVGGGILGAFFGLLSFFQCFGVGMSSEFGASLVSESTLKAALLCVVSRILAGVLAGTVHFVFKNRLHAKSSVCGAVTGLSTAVFNTIFFMTFLMLLFGDADFLMSMRGERNVILFVFAFVGVNAVIEMVVSTIATALSELAIDKTRLFIK